MKIDLDRGVSIRVHGSGMRIYMYKDEPGVFYDPTGGRVKPELAAEAGFNVEELTRERKKLAALAAAKRRIDEEFATAEDDMRSILSVDTGHEVRHLGFGNYAVFDASGRQLTKRAMTKAQATALLEGLIPRDDADGEEGEGDGKA